MATLTSGYWHDDNGYAWLLPTCARSTLVVHGLLGDGVADPQPKGLGEYLRSRVVDIPEALLDV